MKTLGKISEWRDDGVGGYVVTDGGDRAWLGRHVLAAAGLDEPTVGTRIACSLRGNPTGGLTVARVELIEE